MMVDPTDIKLLPAHETVRRRPEMYVGELDGLLPNILLREALCCARDEARLGRCKTLHIRLGADGNAQIVDDGPGLPLSLNSDGTRLAELYFTKLYACASAKPTDIAESTCEHGLAILNFLCARLTLRIFADGSEWLQHYVKGVAIDLLKVIGSTIRRGTELSLTLDPEILSLREFDREEFTEWARHNLNDLAVTIHDTRCGSSTSF